MLYDLKLFGDDAHRLHSGAGNRQILANLRLLDPTKVVVRIPLIPGISDSSENIRAISEYAASIGVTRIHLLPFNGAAGAKYEWLGRRYAVSAEVQSKKALASLAEAAEESGAIAEVD